MTRNPKIRTQSTFPATLRIDGADIDVRVKRMTNTEYDAFAEGFSRWGGPRGTDETVDVRAAREADSAAWLRESLNEYFSIVPGEIEHDGREITKGGDLLTIYGGREDVVPQAIAICLMENRVTEAQKKNLQVGARFSSWLAERAPADGHWRRTGTDCRVCRAEQLCAGRGCDGTLQRRVVWHDGPIVLKTCPVLSFTPDVESALRWFTWTHAVSIVPMAGIRYERVAWPAKGGAGDQDAWLTSALEYLRGVYNAMMREAAKRSERETRKARG